MVDGETGGDETQDYDPEALYKEYLRRQRIDPQLSLDSFLAGFPTHVAEQVRVEDSLAGAPIDETRSAGAPSLEEAIRRRQYGLQNGQVVDGYEIIEPISFGGFGEVYKARKDGVLAALKVIRPELLNEKMLKRFRAELTALKRLNHSMIPKLLGHGTLDDGSGSPYYAMEFVDGKPFDQHSRDLPLADRLRLLVQACSAVSYANDEGVIHRDLKPSNMLVETSTGQPRLIDFGLAKGFGEDLVSQTLTGSSDTLGTLVYMAPEQAQNQGKVGPWTDVYALGVMLYRELTGCFPLEVLGQNFADFLKRLPEEVPTRPSLRVDKEKQNAIKPFDWVAMKALEKETALRYQSVAELSADIEACLGFEKPKAKAPSAGRRSREFSRRHRSRIGVGVIVAVLALVAVWVWLGARRDALYEDAISLGDAYSAEHGKVKKLYAAWKKAQSDVAGWEPYWRRTAEIDALEKLLPACDQLAESFETARVALVNTIENPVDEESRLVAESRLAELDARHRDEDPSLGVAIAAIERLLPRPIVEPSDAQATIRVKTTPDDADVYVFRYKEHEGRFLPLPFDPTTARMGDPLLIVGKLRAEVSVAVPFETGDRFVSVNGVAVSTRTELASVLESVGEDETTSVVVKRGGVHLDPIDWIPFNKRWNDALTGSVQRNTQHSLPRTSFVNAAWQFGFSFEGYPLDTSEGVLTKEFSLPAGSYLFVADHVDHEPLRFPVLVEAEDLDVALELLPTGTTPTGFVYVPPGVVALGGEHHPEEEQSLGLGTPMVNGFFLSRLEVTFAEWLEFLNAIDPSLEQGRRPAHAPSLSGKKVLLIPKRRGGATIAERGEDGRWVVSASSLHDPVRGISYAACLEYAHWKSENESVGGWKYRLPSGREWERAARGVDRRSFVWGNYLVWSHCEAGEGGLFGKTAFTGGLNPFDESPFAIMDMNGAVSEFTEDWPKKDRVAYRGGAWNQVDIVYFLLANRNGAAIDGTNVAFGFRLVAYRDD